MRHGRCSPPGPSPWRPVGGQRGGILAKGQGNVAACGRLRHGLRHEKRSAALQPLPNVGGSIAQATLHPNVSCETYRLQLKAERRFMHEHLAGATSWHEEAMEELAYDKRVVHGIGHMRM